HENGYKNEDILSLFSAEGVYETSENVGQETFGETNKMVGSPTIPITLVTKNNISISMANINAQDYINQKYPKNGTCDRNADPENKGKRREEITNLDISLGKIGANTSIFGNGEPKKLFGTLKLEGFTNLRNLKICSHHLTSLDVSACINLEDLDCHDNELSCLNINGCSNLKKINCFNKPGLNEANIIHDNRVGKLVKKLRSEPKQNSSQKVKQERNANVKQERNTKGKQERNTSVKQERNTNVKQERNFNSKQERNFIVKQERNTNGKQRIIELSIKRDNLNKLQSNLSQKFRSDRVKNIATFHLFMSHKKTVAGTDVNDYYSKNLTALRNALGSDTEGHKILDQIISLQKEIIALENELESVTTPPPPYYLLDNINYDRPVCTINSNFDTNSPTDVNESKMLDKHFDPIVTIGQTLNNTFDFLSVRSVIFEKPSTTEYSKVEKLFLKLETQKDSLDNVLNSQNVYAIGPYLQKDYSVPCIACWVAEPLKASVMEEISALFNDEFEVMYHLVNDVNINGNCEDHDDETNESSNGSHNVNGGPGGNIPNGISSSKVTGSSNERGENEEIECEDKAQTFNITVDLWAKIEPPSKYKNEKTLEFKVDLGNCGVTEFLSKQCSSLHGFVCYYLDSFEISFSPISQSLNNTSSIIRKINFFPNKQNNSINHSKSRDKEHHLQIEAGYPTNAKGTYSYGMKKSRSTTITLNEWDVDIDYCETNGIQWSYLFTGDDVLDIGVHRKCIQTDDSHYGHLYLSSEAKGFCITITQVLGYKENRNVFKKLFKRPVLIKQYPKLVHKLEISFNDIVNFNENFKELEKKLHKGQCLTLENNNDRRLENNTLFNRELSSSDKKTAILKLFKLV
ncbi:2783_t:CDS:2, partial [Gigaspora margarita]